MRKKRPSNKFLKSLQKKYGSANIAIIIGILLLALLPIGLSAGLPSEKAKVQPNQSNNSETNPPKEIAIEPTDPNRKSLQLEPFYPKYSPDQSSNSDSPGDDSRFSSDDGSSYVQPTPGSNNCTLTIGFWKTHAGFGPQADAVTPLLPVWLGTPNGAKSVQVTTAAQAVDLLSKQYDASNGINKVYAQLLGAKLNHLSGANPEALTSLAEVESELAMYSASDWSAMDAETQQKVISWNTELDDYNNGRIGPGHCGY